MTFVEVSVSIANVHLSRSAQLGGVPGRCSFVSAKEAFNVSKDPQNKVSMDEIEAEDAVSLPNKEVMSLLDVNANVDLGLDLAAPVDLAAAANLNVAAPIEAAASANVLSSGAEAVGYAEQHGTIDQQLSGTAAAVAPQHASVDQSAGTTSTGTSGETGTPASGASDGATSTPTEPAAGGGDA